MSIINLFKDKESNAYPFKPNNDFYRELGINKKRFAMILKNDALATYGEMQLIAKFLDIRIEDLIKN